MVAEFLQQGQEWHAEDGVVATFDGFKELQTHTFKPIGADAMENLICFYCEIAVSELIGEIAHCQGDCFTVCPQDFPVVGESDRGVELVASTFQSVEMITGLVDR